MPTVFGTLTDMFYTAFFESDQDKRRAAIEAWIKDATPILQSAVENELRSYLEYVLEKTWTTEGWQSRAKKFSGTTQDVSQRRSRSIPFMEGLQLRLDVSLGRPWDYRRGEKVQVVGPVSSEAHADALRIAQQTLSQIDPTEASKLAKPSAENTELNIMVGLCLGHDIMFLRYCKAETTPLVVKDRVLGHNPIAALYLSTSYYKTRFFKENK
ncbi:DUF1847 domain-containing protein [Chloroflexota bacterium]